MTDMIKTPVVTSGGTYEVDKGKAKQTRKPNTVGKPTKPEKK